MSGRTRKAKRRGSFLGLLSAGLAFVTLVGNGDGVHAQTKGADPRVEAPSVLIPLLDKARDGQTASRRNMEPLPEVDDNDEIEWKSANETAQKLGGHNGQLKAGSGQSGK